MRTVSIEEILTAWRRSICFADEVRHEDGTKGNVIGASVAADLRVTRNGPVEVGGYTCQNRPKEVVDVDRSELYPAWWPAFEERRDS